MARKKTNPHVGSDFEGFLTEEGRLEESTALSIKRVLAWEFDRAMKKADVRKRSSRDGRRQAAPLSIGYSTRTIRQ